MGLLSRACLVLWLTPTHSFMAVPPIASRKRVTTQLHNGEDGRIPPSPETLRARAAAIREELKELEATAAATRRPNAELAEPKRVVPFPETLLDSCWKIVMDLRGVKSDKNRVPVRLVFCCKFAEDDFILEVESDNRFVKRGYVWEPDRNNDEDKEFITFIAEVEGLSAVPDGRIFMNAFIDKIEGDDGKTRYKFSEGAVTIKEVIDKSFWGVFNTAGLLAEFKVVGTWDASPIDALPEKKSSPEK
ncbi:unnamed protein product [Ectocarpus sp. 6 AP-2014]